MDKRNQRRFEMIGVDRLVRLDWLQETAQLALAGDDVETIKNYLREHIQGEFPSSDSSVRGSIDKTLTILLKIWVRPPKELQDLHARALEHLQDLSRQERLPLHWGMTMAVYPFWGAVAGSVGRLLGLQDNVAAVQVQRRLREQYGERQTVSRRVRYLLRSFIDWGVLKEADAQGIYLRGQQESVIDTGVAAWMIEAYLQSISEGSSEFRSILNSPRLFPFHFPSMAAGRLEQLSDGIKVVRHGLDQELVMLA